MPRTKKLHAFTVFEHPIKESNIEDHVRTLIWLGQYAEACAIAKQMRDRPRFYKDMPHGVDRDMAREEHFTRWNFWFGIYTVLSTITIRNELRAKKRREGKRT